MNVQRIVEISDRFSGLLTGSQTGTYRDLAVTAAAFAVLHGQK